MSLKSSLRKGVEALVPHRTQPTLPNDPSRLWGLGLTTTSRSEFKCRWVSDICTKISPGGTESSSFSAGTYPAHPLPTSSCQKGLPKAGFGDQFLGVPHTTQDLWQHLS